MFRFKSAKFLKLLMDPKPLYIFIRDMMLEPVNNRKIKEHFKRGIRFLKSTILD